MCKEIESVRAELHATAYIKEYEYWSNITPDEKIEVLAYRRTLVALLTELKVNPVSDKDKAIVRPPRPSVFDRYQ